MHTNVKYKSIYSKNEDTSYLVQATLSKKSPVYVFNFPAVYEYWKYVENTI
jgi:hypothetical protein